MVILKEKLIEFWKICETKQLAQIFEEYMKSIGARKYDGRRKDNRNTYLIDAKSTNWNRVQCFYDEKDWNVYGEENLLLVLRKKAGNYLIIAKEGKRAFEVDYSGLVVYDEELLTSIMKEHEPLF